MADYRDQFCRLCDVSMDLHDRLDTCESADAKARLMEGMWK